MKDMNPILSADPLAGYLAAQREIDAAIHRVMSSGRYILGPEVEAFEREFADYLGVSGATAVGSGTDALELALRALGIGPGDRVATVPNTVSATASAIVSTGADPVFVDVDPSSMLMDPGSLEAVLADGGVKAVVPVHLYGMPADVPSIVEAAARHGARVVEDCAQAHGAVIARRKAGSWGALSAFSFYPTKNLGGFGDGGAVAGGDPALLDRVRSLRQYGWRERYISSEHGRNSRLDELQAAILRARLPRLDAENARRSILASRYRAELAGCPLALPPIVPGRTHVWHQFVIRTANRESLRSHLAAEGIQCGILYPVPLHRQPAYARFASLHGFPNSERACAEVLSLPLHLGMGEAEVNRVATAVRSWSARAGRG